MSAITAKASRKMKKYAVLTREPRCFLGSFDFSWEQRKLSEMCGTFEYGLNAAAKEFDGKNKYIRITDIDDASREFLLSDLSSPDICLDGMSKYLLSSGDIVFARTGASVGKTYIYRENDGIVYFAGFLIRAKVNQDNDAEFVFQSTLSPSYEKYIRITSQRSGQPGVNAQEYGEYDLFAPSKEEQQRIGHFLRGIDNLITLHQRKCANLCSPSQVVFSLLFATSTFSWEQRKVQDVADRFDNLRIPVAANLRVHGTTPYYGANGIQDYVEGFTHDGEFVLVAEDGANDLKNYPVKCVNGRIWVNNHAHVLQGKAGISDNSFLAFAISQSDIESLLVGGSRAKLNAETLMSIEFKLPCLQEQYRIGEYLTQLDHLITLHQRECISFAGRADWLILTANKKRTTSSWEQRKAIDIADYSKGNGYSKGDLTDAGTPIILYGRLYTKYQFAISEVDTFAVPRNGAVYSQGNEVIVPASGETAEDIARASAVEKSGVLLGGDLNILRPFDFINPLFLALAISNGEPQKELAKKAQGKSVVHIHNTDIQEVTIAYPSRTEQDRIVSVFRQLDNLITLHQRKPFLMKWRTSDANRNKTNRLVL